MIGRIVIAFLGIMFIYLGIRTVKNEKYGPEEGFRGNIIKGKFAVGIGIIHVLIGIVLIFFVIIV